MFVFVVKNKKQETRAKKQDKRKAFVSKFNSDVFISHECTNNFIK